MGKAHSLAYRNLRAALPELPPVELVRVADVTEELATAAARRYGWRDAAGGWRFDPARSGGGALVDVGSHAIDLARVLGGEVTAVLARSRTFFPGRAVDDGTEILLEHEGGAAGSLELSWAAAGHAHSLG